MEEANYKLTVVQFVGRVPSMDLQLIPPLRRNTLQLLKLQKRLWIKNFIIELGVVPSIENVIPLYCDNTGAIAQEKEPRAHQKSKHVERKYYIIREILSRGDIVVCKVSSEDNVADPLTNAIPPKLFDKYVESMGIRYNRY